MLPSIVVKKWVCSCLSWVVGLLWVMGFCLVFGRSAPVVVGCNGSGLRRWFDCRANGRASDARRWAGDGASGMQCWASAVRLGLAPYLP